MIQACTREQKNRKTRQQQKTHRTVKENKNTTTHTSEISSNIIQKDILAKEMIYLLTVKEIMIYPRNIYIYSQKV